MMGVRVWGVLLCAAAARSQNCNDCVKSGSVATQTTLNCQNGCRVIAVGNKCPGTQGCTWAAVNPPPTKGPVNPPPPPPTKGPVNPPPPPPTKGPSRPPSKNPSSPPLLPPTLNPSIPPSPSPSKGPSPPPSLSPLTPTLSPTDGVTPTKGPISPSLSPSKSPSAPPSSSPVVAPSASPSHPPSTSPIASPAVPSTPPSVAPVIPTLPPSSSPTPHPSLPSSLAPSLALILSPSLSPSRSPVPSPTSNPVPLRFQAPTVPPTPAPPVLEPLNTEMVKFMVSSPAGALATAGAPTTGGKLNLITELSNCPSDDEPGTDLDLEFTENPLNLPISKAGIRMNLGASVFNTVVVFPCLVLAHFVVCCVWWKVGGKSQLKDAMGTLMFPCWLSIPLLLMLQFTVQSSMRVLYYGSTYAFAVIPVLLLLCGGTGVLVHRVVKLSTTRAVAHATPAEWGFGRRFILGDWEWESTHPGSNWVDRWGMLFWDYRPGRERGLLLELGFVCLLGAVGAWRPDHLETCLVQCGSVFLLFLGMVAYMIILKPFQAGIDAFFCVLMTGLEAVSTMTVFVSLIRKGDVTAAAIGGVCNTIVAFLALGKTLLDLTVFFYELREGPSKPRDTSVLLGDTHGSGADTELLEETEMLGENSRLSYRAQNGESHRVPNTVTVFNTLQSPPMYSEPVSPLKRQQSGGWDRLESPTLPAHRQGSVCAASVNTAASTGRVVSSVRCFSVVKDTSLLRENSPTPEAEGAPRLVGGRKGRRAAKARKGR
eukprot:Hpha_TRINITY_DN16113_c0_g1::TRINITY_DN16113_c0_g1_i8::g.8850::m.8850